MQAIVVQGGHEITKSLWANSDSAMHALGPWHIDLIDVDNQLLTIPLQTTWPNLEIFCTAVNALTATLCHGPTLTAFAIQSHIQSAKIFRICNTTLKASSQCVIRRKNASYKSNDGQAIVAVIT